MKLSIKVFIGMIMGIVVGLLFGGSPGFTETWVRPWGLIFLSLIKMVVVPLIFSTLIVGASSAGHKKMSRVGVKAVLYYLFTTAFAVTLGLVWANLINPGTGITIPLDAKYEGIKTPSMTEFISGIVPSNPIKAIVDGNMLQIIVFALFMGSGISLVGEKAAQVLHFFKGMAEIFNRIAAGIMEAAPIGVFALIVPAAAANGPKILAPLAALIITFYICCILHAAIVYSASVRILGNMNPLVFFKELFPVMITAYSTCSSTASLPISVKTVGDKLRVSKEVSSFVMPLGTVLNTDGDALYLGVGAVFIAQVYAIDLTLSQQITVILTAVLASIGTAGIPGGGLIILSIVLQSVGLPLEGIALIAGIDRVLDMAKITVNVVGDASAAVVIEYSEKQNESDAGKGPER